MRLTEYFSSLQESKTRSYGSSRSSAVTVDVITADQIEELDRLLIENPDMKKQINKIISKVLNMCRASLSKHYAKMETGPDPRQAYRAVKRTVYKRLLGGQVSILNKRRASSTRVNVQRDRKLDMNPHQRGGNRRPRSQRTDMVDSYFGSDRGFILRFLNAGTTDRQTRFGRRGSIAARNWFPNSSQKLMEQAADQFTKLVDQEIQKIIQEYR